jgi:hypothetical protein
MLYIGKAIFIRKFGNSVILPNQKKIHKIKSKICLQAASNKTYIFMNHIEKKNNNKRLTQYKAIL